MARTDVQPRPPAMLAGKSARYWVRAVGVGMLSSVALSLLLGIVAATAPASTRNGLLTFIAAAAFVVGVVSLVASIKTITAMRRERRAGYTTLDRVAPDLWELDAVTGAVLRPPWSKAEGSRRTRHERQ